MAIPVAQFIARRAFQASSDDVASRAPSGQPRPFERHSVTVSNRRPYSAAAMPVATDAFMSLAPSRCSFRSSSRAVVTTSSISSIRQQRPPDEL